MSGGTERKQRGFKLNKEFFHRTLLPRVGEGENGENIVWYCRKKTQLGTAGILPGGFVELKKISLLGEDGGRGRKK